MSKKFKIGIDYGGTKIEGILIDAVGKEIERITHVQCSILDPIKKIS